MSNTLHLLVEGILVSVVCLTQQHVAVSAPPEMIDIPNPEFENRGEGWMLSEHGSWEAAAGRHGNACARIKSNSEARVPRCVLLTPELNELEPGMKVRVAFSARWLAGDNKVYAGFHEDKPYWCNEPPLWEGEIPPDGKWHRRQVEMRVPQFLHQETSLKLCLGFPFTSLKAGAHGEDVEYLLDDISMEVLEPGNPAAPKLPVTHSFVKGDPRDEASPYGVFWTAWKTYCRTPISDPHGYDKTHDEIRRELDLMQRIGVKWIRSIWRWDKLEWERGELDFALLDFVVTEAWRRDIRIVPALTTPPRWASTAPEDDPDYNIYPPKTDDWKTFVFRTVEHFKEHVKYWEIWNEPNVLDRWNGTVEDYFQLQKTAFLAARRADPKCKLLMGSFSGAPAHYLDGLLRLGAKDYFDILSYHPYPRKYGLKKVDYLTRRMRAVLAEYGCEDRPIWFTEIGCKAVNAGGEAGRAQFLAELYTHEFDEAVEKRFWFTFDIWHKRPDGMGHGLINTSEETVQLCPAYEAYGKVTGKLASAAQDAREGNDQCTHFSFKKRGKLISRPTGMPKPGPYYTCLVKMDGVDRFPYKYALYFSTDHDAGKGGIWLYVANGDPTDADSWKSYDQTVADGDFDYLQNKPVANPIFFDSVQGRQTETPHANVIDGTVYMTYHNVGAGHNQSTLLATSPDGVNFTRIHGKNDSVILDYDPRKEVGNGHTGYLRWRPNPFPDLDYKYVGYSLHGGGDDFYGAMWASNDAIHWDKLQVFDAIEGHAVEGNRIIRRRSIDPNSITDLGNGEFVAICSLGHRSSGGRPRRLELYEIFLGSDGKALTRRGRKILSNGPADSYDAEELETPTTIVIGNKWHMLYVGTRNKARENTVMGAVGTLDLSAPRSPGLSPTDQTRDFHRSP